MCLSKSTAPPRTRGERLPCIHRTPIDHETRAATRACQVTTAAPSADAIELSDERILAMKRWRYPGMSRLRQSSLFSPTSFASTLRCSGSMPNGRKHVANMRARSSQRWTFSLWASDYRTLITVAAREAARRQAHRVLIRGLEQSSIEALGQLLTEPAVNRSHLGWIAEAPEEAKLEDLKARSPALKFSVRPLFPMNVASDPCKPLWYHRAGRARCGCTRDTTPEILSLRRANSVCASAYLYRRINKRRRSLPLYRACP